ncbi:MAG TPA: hypothetical protein VEQ66_04825 [Propionibacteriaceae bacterium]|nr:hypothetical protein [Propionibacteriaceae bacterium]
MTGPLPTLGDGLAGLLDAGVLGAVLGVAVAEGTLDGETVDAVASAGTPAVRVSALGALGAPPQPATTSAAIAVIAQPILLRCGSET